MCLCTLRDSLANDQMKDKIYLMYFNDLMMGVTASSNMKTLEYLTDVMKQTLISGVIQIETCVAVEAFEYYSKTEFDDTPNVVPLMKRVVELYVDNGGILTEE